MATFANIFPAISDDIAYAAAVTLPSVEADLGSPITCPSWVRSIEAVLQFSVTGAPATTDSYVVMQTDLGDGVWIDLGWILYTDVSASRTYGLSGGQTANAVSGSQRVAGTDPSSPSATVALPVGARIRFVGQAKFTGGANPAVTCTIKYKLVGQR